MPYTTSNSPCVHCPLLPLPPCNLKDGLFKPFFNLKHSRKDADGYFPETLSFQSLLLSFCRGKITEVHFKMKQQLENNTEVLITTNLKNSDNIYTSDVE
jgi:hypothetical protein